MIKRASHDSALELQMEPGTDEEQSSRPNSPKVCDEVMERFVGRRQKRLFADCGLERSQSVPLLPFQRVDAHKYVDRNATLRPSVGTYAFSQDSINKKSTHRDNPVYGIDNTYQRRAGSLANSGDDSASYGMKSDYDYHSSSLGKRGLSSDGLMDNFTESVMVSTTSQHKRFKTRDSRPRQDRPVEDNESPHQLRLAHKSKEEQSIDDVDYGQVNSFLREIHLNKETRKRQRTTQPSAAHAVVPLSYSSRQPPNLQGHQRRYHQEYLDRQRTTGDQDGMVMDTEL